MGVRAHLEPDLTYGGCGAVSPPLVPQKLGQTHLHLARAQANRAPNLLAHRCRWEAGLRDNEI